MKTKTKLITKLFAVFAVMFLCLGVATISLTGQSGAIAAETTATTKPVYNFYNVEDRSCLNGNYGVQSTDSSKYITDNLETDETYGYILTLTCNTAMNGVGLRNTEVKFVKGVTYNISFYAMCKNYASNSNWYVYPTVLKNGSIVQNFDNNRAQGNLTDWTKKSYTYTANGDEDELRLVVNMQAGDVIQLRNIEVSLPANQFDGKINLAQGEDLLYRSGVLFTKTTADDSAYGNVTKFTTQGVSGSGDTANSVYRCFRNTMAWKEGATYDVIFRIKTDSTARVKCYLQAKVAGKADTTIVANVLNGKAQTSWKTYYARFKYEDMFTNEDTGRTDNDIFLMFTSANENAEIYMTDIEVYADLSKITIEKTNDHKYDYLDYVVKGANYTLPSLTYENDNISDITLPIGWGYSGNLYNAGDVIENVSNDITIKRVLICFATREGTYFRLSESEPGLRFITDADKEDIESTLKTYYGDNASFSYGMHVTAVDAENNAIKGYMDIETTIWQEDDKYFASAITGFTSENSQFYTATFTVTAYIKVVSGSETITINAKSYTASGSIVSLAKTAYEDRSANVDTENGYETLIENDSHDTTLNGKYSKYSTDELEIIWNLSQLNATTDNTGSEE